MIWTDAWVADILHSDGERDFLRRRLVELLAGFMPRDQVALRFGLTRAQLEAEFGGELRRGPRIWNLEMLPALYERMAAGDYIASLLLLLATDAPGATKFLQFDRAMH